MIERHPIVSRDEWLAWRRRDVTASWIGALFGVDPSPKKTPLHLWAAKRGTEFLEPDETKTMRRGRWLEPSVAVAVNDTNPQWRLTAPKLYLRDPDLRLGATPDFFIDGDLRGIGVLEAKTVAPSVYRDQWQDGREPPLWITLQCVTQMMLADAAFGAIAVLLVDPHNMDCVILDVPRNPDAERKITDAVQKFWLMVVNGHEPDPDFTRDGHVIAAMRRNVAPGTKIDFAGDNELPDMLAQRAHLKARMDADKSRCEEIESEIKYRMGEAEVATGLPGWGVTFKNSEFKEYTVSAATRRVLRIRDKRADAP